MGLFTNHFSEILGFQLSNIGEDIVICVSLKFESKNCPVSFTYLPPFSNCVRLCKYIHL